MGKGSRWLGSVCAVMLLGAIASACSVGNGEGGATGTLNVPNCWVGKFSLAPDFFAGVPYQRSVELRLQEGGDYASFSDGIDILVRDIDAVLGNASMNKPSKLGQALAVRIPPGVTPPGIPVTPEADPALVDFAVYLQRTCKTQNVALYAGRVALGSDGSCSTPPNTPAPVSTEACTGTVASTADGGTTDAGTADGGTLIATTPRVGESTITFKHLFNGIPEEPDASKRLTEASFDVYLADPREVCPSGNGAPPPCRGHLTGSFRFTFERGRPAQRFP